MGDYFTPGLGANNENQRSLEGYIEKIVPDDKVYPARPTTGVNRGYQEKTLDDSLRLVNFTAACGPVIYNGQLFGKEYYGNAFVAEPSANLIKRNILREEGYRVEGKQAGKNGCFLERRWRVIQVDESGLFFLQASC